jgi:hypothetical protein
VTTRFGTPTKTGARHGAIRAAEAGPTHRAKRLQESKEIGRRPKAFQSKAPAPTALAPNLARDQALPAANFERVDWGYELGSMDFSIEDMEIHSFYVLYRT